MKAPNDVYKQDKNLKINQVNLQENDLNEYAESIIIINSSNGNGHGYNDKQAGNGKASAVYTIYIYTYNGITISVRRNECKKNAKKEWMNTNG